MLFNSRFTIFTTVFYHSVKRNIYQTCQELYNKQSPMADFPYVIINFSQ